MENLTSRRNLFVPTLPILFWFYFRFTSEYKKSNMFLSPMGINYALTNIFYGL